MFINFFRPFMMSIFLNYITSAFFLIRNSTIKLIQCPLHSIDLARQLIALPSNEIYTAPAQGTHTK